MNIGIIIQARLSSQRLPAKVIMPIFERWSILDVLIKRLKKITNDLPIIIATGDSEKNEPLRSIARDNNVFFFAGSENDVLYRFIECAKQYNLQKVLRVCADNPFLDYELASTLISTGYSSEYDYVSYKINQKPAILSHYGFFSELVSVNALVKASVQSDNASDKEHVTPYIYNHPDEFSIYLTEAPGEISSRENIRLTVDTQADFNNAARILKNLVENNAEFSYNFKDVLSEVSKMDNSFKLSMAEQIITNSKS